MRQESQRDVVFTPFMLRVRAALDGEDCRAPVRLVRSAPRRLARAADQWFYLRCRSEQVIAEANAMLNGRAEPLDLDDEVGTGRLAFTLRWRDKSSAIWLGQADRQGWVQLERSYQPGREPGKPEDPAEPEEPADPAALEDLVIELLGPVARERNG